MANSTSQGKQGHQLVEKHVHKYVPDIENETNQETNNLRVSSSTWRWVTILEKVNKGSSQQRSMYTSRCMLLYKKIAKDITT